MNLINIWKKIISDPFGSLIYFFWINNSYSQTWEDLILKHLITKDHWFYIDIWANKPIQWNNTYWFYKKGWSGINIEPNKKLIRLFNKKRSRDMNLQIGAWPTWELEFFSIEPDTLSTFDKKTAQLYQSMWHIIKEIYKVPIVSLEEIMSKYANQHVDILSVDVEWYDLEVLQSNNREKYKPSYVILETLEYKKDGTWKKLNDMYDPLFSKWWYEKIADTYINTIYKVKQ